MMALTLRHPWPWAILALGKRLENRRWRPSRSQLKIGEQFAIHGGRVPSSPRDRMAVYEIITGLSLRHHGRYEAWMAQMGGETPNSLDAFCLTGIVAVCRFGGIAEHSDDPWFEGPLAWRLDDLRVLPERVECSGKQGLWRIPETLLACVMSQLGTGVTE